MEGSGLKSVGMNRPSFPPKQFHVEGRYNPLLLSTFLGTTEYLLFGTDGLIFPFSLTFPSVARVRYVSSVGLLRAVPEGAQGGPPGGSRDESSGVQGGLVSAPHRCGSEIQLQRVACLSCPAW